MLGIWWKTNLFHIFKEQPMLQFPASLIPNRFLESSPLNTGVLHSCFLPICRCGAVGRN